MVGVALYGYDRKHVTCSLRECVATIEQTLVHFGSVAVQILTLHLHLSSISIRSTAEGWQLTMLFMTSSLTSNPSFLKTFLWIIYWIKCTVLLFSNCSNMLLQATMNKKQKWHSLWVNRLGTLSQRYCHSFMLLITFMLFGIPDRYPVL